MRLKPVRRSYVLPGLLILALLAAAPAAGATRVVVPDGSSLSGSATTPLGSILGLASPTAPARALIALQHRDEPALLKFIAAVSDPHSPQYQHYLTPEQFDARYAPSTATVSAVESFVERFGLHVAAVPSNRAYVCVTGTVGQIEGALQTSIVRVLRGGEILLAPATALSIPARLAAVIAGIDGLDAGDVMQPLATGQSLLQTPPDAAYVNPPPFSSYWASNIDASAPGYDGSGPLPDVVQGYTPQQVEGAYGVASAIAAGLDGSGQTVAVIDAYSSPTLTGDVDQWSTLHDLPQPKLVIHDNVLERDQPDGPEIPTDVPILGGLNLQNPSGWFGEETLDVEAVHMIAPQATIVVQSALTDQAIDLEMAQNAVVAGNEAQIVSNSYGNGIDSTDKTSDGYWQQAAAEGIGVYFASGDEGDQTLNDTQPADRSVDGDENSPYVTSVGGTTLAIGSHDNYGFETYWGTNTATLGSTGAWGAVTFSSGGGGGTSQAYAEPAYQKPVVPAQFSDYWKLNPKYASKPVVPGRVVPDVAMLGDPNSGVLTGLTEDFSVYRNPLSEPLPTDATAFGQYRIGGTSLSSPLFAGMMALADQAAGKHHGFANPALYALAGSPAFHDVTSPKSLVAVVRTNYTNSTNSSGGTQTLLRTIGNTATLTSQPGYDDSTGIGSPNGLAFLAALAPGSSLIASLQGPTSGGSHRRPSTNVTLRTCTTGAPTAGGKRIRRTCTTSRFSATVPATAARRSATLQRGTVIYAVGYEQHGRLMLTTRRRTGRGSYTLMLGRKRTSITLH
jgi:subtilase family serine protease